MPPRHYKQSPLQLRVVGFYFLICGVSAITWPSLWYEVSGMKAPQCDLVLAVLGAMMFSLGIGAFLTTSDVETQLILKLLTIANMGDAGIVAAFTLNGTLPTFNGLAFLFIDLICIFILIHAYIKNFATK